MPTLQPETTYQQLQQQAELRKGPEALAAGLANILAHSAVISKAIFVPSRAPCRLLCFPADNDAAALSSRSSRRATVPYTFLRR